jgi:hypothetical protein
MLLTMHLPWQRGQVYVHMISRNILTKEKKIDELQMQRQEVITQRQAIFEEINDQQRKLNEYKKNGPLIKMIKEQRLAMKGISERLK